MRLGKYHGLGNDFVVVDLRAGRAFTDPDILSPKVVRAVCDCHFGVGADGVLAILPPRSPGADATMRVLNADGGEAEMCGNGLRCVVQHLVERDPAPGRDRLVIDTGAGPLECAVHRAAGEPSAVAEVSVEMGRPRLTRGEIPMTGPAEERCVGLPVAIGGRELAVTTVSMGNPHAVAFVDESGPALLERARRDGPQLETHPLFPRRTNVEFVHVHRPDRLELVVWERGCGITLACGTGACAAVVAACLRGVSQPATDVAVALPGGELVIRVAADLGGVTMRGPTRHVFDTDLDLVALTR